MFTLYLGSLNTRKITITTKKGTTQDKKEKKGYRRFRTKNQFVKIGFVLILLCVGLSGCQQQTPENGNTNNEQSELIVINMFVTAIRNDSESYTCSVVFYSVAHSLIGQNLTYEVDTGEDVNYNGIIMRVRGYGHKCTHTYYTWNTDYSVTLTVRDGLGNINTTTRTIHISEPSTEPVFIEKNTNLPEMNYLSYTDVYELYRITAV